MNPEVSIIIINFNTPDLAHNCLESILKHCKLQYEIIIVDNSSNPDLRVNNQALKRILPNIDHKLLVTSNNGFGSANNIGAKQAKGKYLWLLNSDTVLREDTPSKILEFYKKHKEVGAISPVLKHKDGLIQRNFFANFQTLGSITFKRYSSKKIDYDQDFFYTDVVVGAALMIQRDIFEKVKGFDEKIFMYLEDDDLCKRIIDLGYKNAVYTKTSLIHLEGKSSANNKSRKKLYYKSQTYFWRKHNGFWPTIIMRILRWPLKLYRLYL